MTWRKFFKPVNSVLPASQRAVDSTSAYASTSKYSNWLPEVYSGPPDRLQRYAVYDQMTYDHEISAALDTIADFGSEPDEVTKQPLLLKYNDDPTPSETLILEKTLSQWLRLNELNRRLWRIFRSTLVYGDQFFLRDPETFKLYWIDPAKVEKVIVNESDGKKIESYFVKEIDLNMKSLVATNQLNKSSNAAFGSNSIVFSPPMAGNVNYISGGFGGAGSANYQDGSATPVDAEHIVQISLTDGMNAAWPFGISILETIYKIYKQKELLEDAILIYRVHRAPERRVFFIDVGTMPPNKAQQYLERVRYEVQQKRIPSRTGGGCFSMDTKVPLLDGRVLTITELSDEYAAGKQNWAYSCNPTTGEMVPGLITWAGVTQKQAKVMKLTLDNGETVICTPEHKFPVIGKGKIEAKDIVVGEDSLFSFNTREYGINRQGKGSAYHQVFNNNSKEWEYTHRVVAKFIKKCGSDNDMIFNEKYTASTKGVIHHQDYNRLNNYPENLKYMHGADHFELHTAGFSEYWKSLSNENKTTIRNKSIQTRKNWSAEMKLKVSIGQSSYMKEKWADLKSAHPILYKREIRRVTSNLVSRPFNNQSLVFSDNMMSIVSKYVKSYNPSIESLLIYLNNSTEFINEYHTLNKQIDGKISHITETFNITTFRKMILQYGHNSWRHFVKSSGLATKKPSRKYIWNDKILKIFVDYIKKNNITMINDASKAIIKCNEFMSLFANLNAHIKGNGNNYIFTQNTLRVFLSDNGYKTWTDFKSKIGLYNHKVISAEYLDDKMEVGTLTIDGDEKYHNYHTFAIDQGVYTFNSNVVDSTYNPMCITLDTRIPLLDGRTLPLSDLIAEYKNGKENWAYSADPVTGKIVPGIISWAGVTRKNADIIKITLDNGEILRCTPDHKIPVLGKGFVEAKDLTVHDPLVSFETRKVSLSKDKDRSYEQIFDHKTNQWHFTHRMVANYFKELNKHQEFTFNEECAADIKDTVHHKDYDRYNNSPINLQWMNRHDHTLYHSFVKKEYWENISPVELNRIKSKIRAGLSKYRLENPDWKKMYETRDISWIADMKDNNPEKYVSWRQSHGKSLSNFYKAGSDKALELKAHAAFNMLKNKANNQTLNFTQPMLTRLVEIVKKHNSDRIDTINLVNSDIKFMQLLKESNPILVNSTHNVKNNKFTNSKLERMYDKFGYKNWKDFKKNIQQYNHRITSIELLSETEDVGTITIDGKEKFHNFHTFAIESGIFVKNSILEDYFFAVTSEGRGSKVEVLPGGENLGDIDDLRYFNNKMLRALGVPSSYLPTGPEDGTAAVSDGRVGAAFIQEHRFSKVVARYQQQVIMPIDLEFKLFLKHRGISIDNSLFELEFTPPQSFSDYRKLELDSARINTFTALMDIPYVSKRFILKEYLGWTEAQLAENERMWKEERSRLTKTFAAEPMGGGSAPAGLSDVGITSSGIDDMSPEGGEEDMTGMEDPGVSDNEVDSFGQ